MIHRQRVCQGCHQGSVQVCIVGARWQARRGCQLHWRMGAEGSGVNDQLADSAARAR